MQILISLIVGLCATVWVHHATWNINASRSLFRVGEATWKLVIVTFIGVSLFTYGVIAL